MRQKIPKATHTGEITLGDHIISCANLDNGKRVLIERSVATALGKKGGGAHWRRKKESRNGAMLPEYVSAKNLAPYIDREVQEKLLQPITYGSKAGKKAQGISAELLPEICSIWLKARENGALTKTQIPTAKKAEILMRGLAHIGIIALIDEATGYQEERDRDELHKILEAFIAKELLPWTKRFPDEYYRQLFRLMGWQYSPPSVKRPQLVGKITNQIVYDKLPRGVLDELKIRNPVTRRGYRKHRHHQFLTEAIGNPHLEKHLASITTLMRASSNWRNFQGLMERAFPDSRRRQLEMELEEIEGSRE